MKLYLKLLLIMVLAPQVALAFDFKEGGLCYNINHDKKTVTLTYEHLILQALDAPPPTEKGYVGNIVIPEKVKHNGKTYKVTAIDRETFMGNRDLKSVIVPKSVKTIGNGAFAQCYSLKNVVLPPDLTEIGNYMFAESNLTEITIPEKVKSIGQSAFSNCPLKSIVIPNSVKNISKSAFSACRWLEKVTLGNSVQTIGEAAFSICPKLKDINLPASLQEIGAQAFYEGGMESVTIPATTKSIGDGAFKYCNKLTTLLVENGNKTYDSRNNCNAVIETVTGTLVAGCNNSVIPESVTKIGDEAFYGCKNIYNIDIPSSVTEIGNQAFFYCTNLRDIELPNSVTSIGERAFCGCDSLETVTIPNSVKHIGYGTFLHDKKMKAVTIGSGVISISEWAFKGLNNLQSIICDIEDVTSVKLGKNVFDEIDKSKCTLYVPKGTTDTYMSSPQWKEFTRIIER